MEQRYKSTPQVLAALKKRKIKATLEEVESALNQLGLHEPYGPGDVNDLAAHLWPKRTVNQRIIKVETVLASKEWADAIVGVRLELGLPSTGLPKGEARELHAALLDTEFGEQPTDVKFDDQDWKPVAKFWKELVSGSRRLCTLLEIDPRPLDDLRALNADGIGSALIGVRKLLNPEGVLKVGGYEMPYRPSQIDYLIGHLLWDLPLDPGTMEPKPSVTYQWKRLADGSGRQMPHMFNEKGATASERKEMRKKLRDAKRTCRELFLLTVAEGESWRGLTWEECWRQWNRLFPDFSFQTQGALRKACNYAVKHKGEIRARYETLMQAPGEKTEGNRRPE